MVVSYGTLISEKRAANSSRSRSSRCPGSFLCTANQASALWQIDSLNYDQMTGSLEIDGASHKI